MNAAFALIARDVRLAWRHPNEIATILAFFVIAASLFPFGIGPEPQILARVAIGIVWVTALLACLMSLDRLFQAEAEDGSLDLLVTAPASLELIALAKVVAQWITTALPLIVISPIVATMLHLPADGYATLLLTLLLGTPGLSLFGGIGAALSVNARRGGALLALIVLPLTVPILIFAVAAVDAAIAGLSPRPHLFLLSGLSVFALTIAPFAMAASLRQAAE